MSSLNGILCVGVFVSMCLLFNSSSVTAFYLISELNVTNIGTTTFTLEWAWDYLEDGDEGEPAGFNISTYTVGSFRTLLETVEVNGTANSYTVKDTEPWTRYESCIIPIMNETMLIITNETTELYILFENCTDILTLYDPWTTKSQFAVVCTLWLVFALLVARIIEFIWPRAEKRTFSLDALDESDDGQADLAKKDDAGIHNFGFIRSDEEGSIAEDWNAAAIAALKRPDDKPVADQDDILTELQKLSGNAISDEEEHEDNNDQQPQLADNEDIANSVYQEIPASETLYANVPHEESVRAGSGRVDESHYDDAAGYDWRENETGEDIRANQPSRHVDQYDPYNDYQNREVIMEEMDLDDLANYF
ncbi:uncharacterized protein [Diadema antillarum]|uniref:uncharacterized protein n=1 Tax=Diadema antillarum TaxID=105358 RepID=UPI003A888A9B